MGLIDIFRRRKMDENANVNRNDDDKKLARLHALLRECDLPSNLTNLTPDAVWDPLGRLFVLLAAKSAERAGYFFGIEVLDAEASHIWAELDPKPLIDRWTSALRERYGDGGHSLVGELADQAGIKIEGAVIRSGRRYLTFIPAPKRLAETIPLPSSILNEPNNVDAYLVYSDLLQEQGDVHGKYIALAHAANKEPKLKSVCDEFLAQNKRQLLGQLAYDVGDNDGAEFRLHGLALDWFLGSVRRARIHGQVPNFV